LPGSKGEWASSAAAFGCAADLFSASRCLAAGLSTDSSNAWKLASSRSHKALSVRIRALNLGEQLAAWGRFCKNTTAIGTVTQCQLCVQSQTSIFVPLLRAFALALRGEPHFIVKAFCSPVINSRQRIESPLIPPRRRAEVQKRSGWQYVV